MNAADQLTCPHCGDLARVRLLATEAYCMKCGCLLAELPARKPLPFGKYAGQLVSEMNSPERAGYLRWALTNVQRLDLPLRLAIMAQLGYLVTSKPKTLCA